jgi:hypothetical protein
VDIVITTALIPGKKAPILIKKYMIGMLDNLCIHFLKVFAAAIIAEIEQCAIVSKLNFCCGEARKFCSTLTLCRDAFSNVPSTNVYICGYVFRGIKLINTYSTVCLSYIRYLGYPTNHLLTCPYFIGEQMT